MICHPSSVPPGIAIHKPARRALICQMSPSTTVVTDHQGAHAIPAHMTQLLAIPAYNVAVTTAANTTTTTTTAATATAFYKNVGFWALSSYVPSYIAQVADGIVWTITCQVASLPTIVACLFVCAVSCNMTLLITVVAQPQVARW
jgi:hypothetical protein